MAIHQITPDFYFIERGMLNANHLVYAGNFPVLVDTGHPNSVTKTKELISQTGVKTSEISQIINTHTHADHIGANAALQAESGCEIGLHQYGQYFVSQKSGFFLGWRYENVEMFEARLSLKEGRVLTFGDYEFEIIHTPGHAFDGIVFYEKKRQWLISGDALWEYDLAAINPQKQGGAVLFEVRKSLEKLSKLSVKLVFPGHGQMFENYDKALEKNEQKLAKYLDNPQKLGKDFMKKVLIYTLLKGPQLAKGFFDKVQKLDWYRDTVELYFPKKGKTIYEEIIGQFVERGIIEYQDGFICTTVNPG